MTQVNSSNNKLDTVKKDISTQVLSKINEFQSTGELKMPKDYSPENALKAAYLVLSDPKTNLLMKCTKESIANALLKMVVWGLSPLKKQCDFIAYGDKLDCSIEYTGNIALAKRYGNLKWIKAKAIFEQDDFAWNVDAETGRNNIVSHKQTLDSISEKAIKGAYAIYELKDGTRDVEIMSISQIRDAWNQGAMKGNSPAHKNFPDQMSIKTVINRACKILIRSSDDSVLVDDDGSEADKLKQVVDENANLNTIDFEDAEQVYDDEPKITHEKEDIEEEDKGTDKNATPGF
ncbi:MAG: RecT family recombinase [Lentimicrobium sp.]|jgi:recombination protein RecT|nr:RecT family recombinase [Lentimicrobium sp.]